ncbi:MAG: oligosaccharide flippase family protein [Inhella sp.]
MQLLRASLTLVLGNALAHALPLLLGPWIARLYSPAEYAQFSLVWAVCANLTVVACARYEYALPLVQGHSALRALLALCLRVLALVWALSGVAAAWLALRWPAMALLPALLIVGGGVQLLSLLATREQLFARLAGARVLQWGGAPVLQVGLGTMALGVWGLLLAPLLAGLAALLWLLWPLRAWLQGSWRVGAGRWRTLAWRYKDFPLLNTPHAFASAAQDTLALLLITAWAGDVATGLWALALRYLKAPATLVGSAVSSALYPQLTQTDRGAGHAQLRRTIRSLLLLALTFAALLMLSGPELFAWAFGEPWREAGTLARALAPYLALHFVASPLAVVTMAWQAQGWALRLALWGQGLFLLGLVVGLQLGGLEGAGWGVSLTMTGYFAYYLMALWRWPYKQ